MIGYCLNCYEAFFVYDKKSRMVCPLCNSGLTRRIGSVKDVEKLNEGVGML